VRNWDRAECVRTIGGRLTSIGIAAEVAGPGDVRVALVLAGGDGIEANGGDNGCVA
jgi:hypothetical protein